MLLLLCRYLGLCSSRREVFQSGIITPLQFKRAHCDDNIKRMPCFCVWSSKQRPCNVVGFVRFLKSYGSIAKNTNWKHFKPVRVWRDQSAPFEVKGPGATARDYNNGNSNNKNRNQLQACKWRQSQRGCFSRHSFITSGQWTTLKPMWRPIHSTDYESRGFVQSPFKMFNSSMRLRQVMSLPRATQALSVPDLICKETSLGLKCVTTQVLPPPGGPASGPHSWTFYRLFFFFFFTDCTWVSTLLNFIGPLPRKETLWDNFRGNTI